MTYPTPLDPEKFVLMVTSSILVVGYLWHVFTRKLTSNERIAVSVAALVIVVLALLVLMLRGLQ